MTKANEPGQPTLVVEATGENSIWLSWTPADTSLTVGAPTGYKIRYRELPSSQWSQIDPGSATTYHHMGRQPGRTYNYQVAAENSAGLGDWSAETGTTTMSTAKPSKPTNVMVEDASVVATDGSITTTQLKISWNKVSGATGYEIQRWLPTATPNAAWGSVDGTAEAVTAVTGDGDTESYTDSTGLAAGMTYHYIVRAVNGTVNGDWTADYSGMTKQSKPATAPTLVAQSRGERSVQLSWSAVTGATSYKVRFIATEDKPQNVRDSDYTPISLSPADSMHYTHTGRTAGTSYEYSVQAILPNDVMSDWSADVKVTTRPARPTGFSAQASDHQTVNLTWNHVSFDGSDLEGTDNYTVEVREGGTTTWAAVTVVCGGTPVACTAMHDENTSDLAAEENTQYYYRLRAVGTAGAHATFSYWVQANETTPDDPTTN